MTSSIASERRGSIIVVEDEPVVAIYLRRRLEDLGWTVLACVCSGEEAVRVGAQQRPDLMLMDVCLDGDVDGPQAAHQLQDLFGIPSVFLTAYTDRETIERCKGAQPLGYLTKPVDEQLLALTLEMALSFDKKRQERAREEQARRSLEGRAQKMDAVGRLAASVANDFNNLLQAVGANHYLMALQARPELNPILQDCEALVARGSSLTRQLLSLSGRDDGETPAAHPLRQLLEQSLRLSRRMLGAHVRVLSNAATAEGQVRVASAQFEQVLSNLVSNAKDAMSSGGELTIHAGPHPALGGHVLIEVMDTGPGIAPADLPHIFEPFFTTKPPGVGTGLGLPVVKRTVERWGGCVSVISRHGSGCAFGITLPYAASPAAAPAARTQALGSERILLLEPNGHVRGALHWLLSASGYAVLGAESAEQAERELRPASAPDLTIASSSFLGAPASTPSAVSLAALRGRLLVLGGATSAAALAARWPTLRRATLLLPLEPEQLLEAVRRGLEQPPTSSPATGAVASRGDEAE
jgi:signal transduction histidine kinase